MRRSVVALLFSYLVVVVATPSLSYAQTRVVVDPNSVAPDSVVSEPTQCDLLLSKVHSKEELARAARAIRAGNTELTTSGLAAPAAGLAVMMLMIRKRPWTAVSIFLASLGYGIWSIDKATGLAEAEKCLGKSKFQFASMMPKPAVAAQKPAQMKAAKEKTKAKPAEAEAHSSTAVQALINSQSTAYVAPY
jgi:hypothetical protein